MLSCVQLIFLFYAQTINLESFFTALSAFVSKFILPCSWFYCSKLFKGLNMKNWLSLFTTKKALFGEQAAFAAIFSFVCAFFFFFFFFSPLFSLFFA